LFTTENSDRAWAVDKQGFVAAEVLPDLLITKLSTVAGHVEGDAPALRVPYVDDLDADLVAEGDEFAEQTGTLSEVVVTTHKVGALAVVSNELKRNGADNPLATGMVRAVTDKANRAFLHNAAAPAGVLNDAAITDGGLLGANLDSINAAMWGIAGTGVGADYIVAAPTAMTALSALKTGTGSNQNLVTEPMLNGLPVLVSNAMPADTILIGSRTAIVSAVGKVNVSRSEHYAFSRDGLAVRVDFRSGWALMRADRLVKISTAAE
jgi:HK97 family phage major capsid protein